MGNKVKVRWKHGGAWMARTSGGRGSVVGVGWLGWVGKCCGHGQEVSDS